MRAPGFHEEKNSYDLFINFFRVEFPTSILSNNSSDRLNRRLKQSAVSQSIVEAIDPRFAE
jgi:hypothetical protein